MAPDFLRRWAAVAPVIPPPTTTTSTSRSRSRDENCGSVEVSDQYGVVFMEMFWGVAKECGERSARPWVRGVHGWWTRHLPHLQAIVIPIDMGAW